MRDGLRLGTVEENDDTDARVTGVPAGLRALHKVLPNNAFIEGTTTSAPPRRRRHRVNTRRPKKNRRRRRGQSNNDRVQNNIERRSGDTAGGGDADADNRCTAFHQGNNNDDTLNGEATAADNRGAVDTSPNNIGTQGQGMGAFDALFCERKAMGENTIFNFPTPLSGIGDSTLGVDGSTKDNGIGTGLQRRIPRQQRAGRFQAVQAATSVQEQFRQFDRGSKTFQKRMRATDGELFDYVNREHGTRAQSSRSQFGQAAFELLQRERQATQDAIRHANALMKEEQYGRVPTAKPDDCYRLMYENWNSLGIFTGKKKIEKIDRLMRQYGVDTLAGCETQCDWRQADYDSQFKNLFAFGQRSAVLVKQMTSELENTKKERDAAKKREEDLLARMSRLETALASQHGSPPVSGGPAAGSTPPSQDNGSGGCAAGQG